MILKEWLFPFKPCFFFNSHRSGVLAVLFGCYMAGATWNCCRLGARSIYTIHQFTVSPPSKSHACIIKYGVCVFSCNLPSAVWAEWPGSFTCYYGNAGLYRYRKSAWKADPGEENSPTAPAGLEPLLTSWSWVQRSNHSTIPAIYYDHDTGKYQCHINI